MREKMSKLRITQKRNLIVLGRIGVGKSTVVNQILGKNVFPVSTPMEGVTREKRRSEEETEIETKDVKEEVEYKIKIIDTVSIRDLKIDAKNILKEIQDYLTRKAPEGVNLVLFVIRKGIFSEEEKETFDNIIAQFQENVKQISALIVNGCEGLRDELSREEEIGAIRKGKSTKSLTEFMGKGVHVVGFPDAQDVLPELKEVNEKGIKRDAEKLRQVVSLSCEKMALQQGNPGEKTNCKNLIIACTVSFGVLLAGLFYVGFESVQTWVMQKFKSTEKNVIH